jgi:hypothetical protein
VIKAELRILSFRTWRVRSTPIRWRGSRDPGVHDRGDVEVVIVTPNDVERMFAAVETSQEFLCLSVRGASELGTAGIPVLKPRSGQCSGMSAERLELSGWVGDPLRGGGALASAPAFDDERATEFAQRAGARSFKHL